MTKIKLCGLSRPCDIHMANEVKPDYIGFVFRRRASGMSIPKRHLSSKLCSTPGSRRSACSWMKRLRQSPTF